jgi:guanylate kinase
MKIELTKRVAVVSAPSGTGKTTLNRMLTKSHPDKIEISVSLTTRKVRSGEQHGLDYFFVSESEFKANVDHGRMLEWANVHGNLYGTSLDEVHAIQGRGHQAILEIDVQGWEQARQKLENTISVFLLPPSMQDLWDRLKGRGTDSFETRLKRFKNARSEIAAAKHYDYFVINRDLREAYQELEQILVYGNDGVVSSAKGLDLCHSLLNEFPDQDLERILRKQESPT